MVASSYNSLLLFCEVSDKKSDISADIEKASYIDFRIVVAFLTLESIFSGYSNTGVQTCPTASDCLTPTAGAQV